MPFYPRDVLVHPALQEFFAPGTDIAGSIDEFRNAAHGLLMELAVRIERENQYLYPLAEREVERSRKAA